MSIVLKSAIDDAPADQRAQIAAIYVILLAVNALAWAWALLALVTDNSPIARAIISTEVAMPALALATSRASWVSQPMFVASSA